MDTSDEEDELSEAPPVRIPLGHPPVVFSLPGSEDLSAKAIHHLQWRGGKCSFGLFANGEISCKVEDSVANHDVFVFCVRNDTHSEVNINLMRLMFLISALRGESPHRLTVVLPCLDYMRQDRRLVAGESIPPLLFLRFLAAAGADRFLSLDLHNEAVAGSSPAGTVFDELQSAKYLATFIRNMIPDFDPDKFVVCATNGGGMRITRRVADELRTGIFVAGQVRTQAGDSSTVRIMAGEEAGTVKAVIVVDDMFDTCGTLVGVCRALKTLAPQAKIYALATHGYFSGKAPSHIKELVKTSDLEWVAVTNSVCQDGPMQRFAAVGIADRLKIIDISRLMAGAIVRIYLGASVNLPKFRDLGPQDIDPALSEHTESHHEP
eukprot:TRINITY_DN27062_c0_g1_i1.p1 TRINITY_DN27062_c0_g1~~TRINITY_DN27062_c0_g1_i1.p1  ORF type:complete len:410 (+),score=55.86 TRINITY_DN27062_c0_g1_i1:99-1232(+)